MKRIKLSIYALTGAIVLMTAGCTKTLEVETVSDITNANYWKAEGDVTGYLTGIYTDFRDLINTTYYLEDRGDSFVEGLEVGITNAWRHNLNPSTAPNWVSFYNTIHHCNLLLKYGANIDFANQSDKDRVMAEAYFLRAYIYFTLLRSWGDVPIKLEPTESDNAPLVSRSPATEVMQQVLADIDKAISLFPETGFKSKSRASQPAAWALKADALIWKAKVLNGGNEDLDNALTAISTVETVSGLALETTYANIFSTSNRNSKEVIFSIYFQRDEKTGMYGQGLKPRDIFVQTAQNKNDLAFAKNGARSNYAPSPKLLALYDENPADKRTNASVIKAIDAGGQVIGVFDNKFRGTLFSDDRYFDNNIIIYRLADIILLKAEALAALNRVPEAIIALEVIRNRAGIGSYPGATDKAAVEKAILDERFLELYLEQKRWPDLVRFHVAGTINVYDEVPNLSGKSTPLFFPIPQSQIDINPNLSQTTGY